MEQATITLAALIDGTAGAEAKAALVDKYSLVRQPMVQLVGTGISRLRVGLQPFVLRGLGRGMRRGPLRLWPLTRCSRSSCLGQLRCGALGLLRFGV